MTDNLGITQLYRYFLGFDAVFYISKGGNLAVRLKDRPDYVWVYDTLYTLFIKSLLNEDIQ